MAIPRPEPSAAKDLRYSWESFTPAAMLTFFVLAAGGALLTGWTESPWRYIGIVMLGICVAAFAVGVTAVLALLWIAGWREFRESSKDG